MANLGKFFIELAPEVTDPTVGENDVGVQDLASHGIGATWTDCRSHIVVEPADKIVPHVFRVFLHVRLGGCILVANLDGVE